MEDARWVEDMTPEELAEVQRIHDVMSKALEKDIWRMARWMATRRDDQLLGGNRICLAGKGPTDGGACPRSHGERP